MTKTLKIYLLVVTLIHLWLVTQFELSHDEAYYWLFSKNLAWGYFDHPPFVAVLIKIFSFLPKSEFSVRAGFVLLQSLTAFILLKMIHPDRQLTALILFFSFPLASISGLLALPDLPLLFMATIYCSLLKIYLEKQSRFSVIGLSIAIPILLYAKYHGILLIFFTVLALPKLFLRKDFYIILAISILLFLPHVIWQYDHDFATLRYHFLERPKSEFQLKRLLEYLMTQIFLPGLFVGPVIWWSIFKNKTRSDLNRALKFISFGTVLFFFISTLNKKFEANWTIFLTVPLILLSVEEKIWDRKNLKRILWACCGVVLLVRFSFITTATKRLKEFHGWRNWSMEIQHKCQEPILANTYQMASKLSFYLDRPIHAQNYHSRKNQFDIWKRDMKYYPTTKVCYVTDKSEFSGEEIINPEGKKMKIVGGLDLSSFN